ncbi:MAG TPA: CPBP family intramembrane glutamic endopeptidase [Steroidobacteraceae bacterium]|nr:CPBP family intramembrane glutamic endopeptidase [Steroidobacteraceae bacterium]
MSRAFLAFLLLFVVYQAPEGLGRLFPAHAALAAALMLLFLPVAWLVARALGSTMSAAYALERHRRSAWLLAAGLLCALLIKGAALAAGAHFGIYVAATPSGEATRHAPVLASLAWLAVSTFFPSIAEDILTRGFWLRIFNRWSAAGFVLFSAALYVANHVFRLANGPGEWLMLFCFGLAYAAALWRFDNLWAAVGLHWGWNFAGPALGTAWAYEVADVERSRLLSASAHLVILGIVLLSGWLSPERPRARGA